MKAQLYDWECERLHRRTTQDVSHYAALAAETGGPVLELACGTGRVAVPLAESAGVEVVGLDNDPDMLAEAERKAQGRVTFVLGDMRDFDLGRRFALVLIPYNSFQLLLTDDDQRACMKAVARHLEPSGTLAVELSDFQSGVLNTNCDVEHLVTAPLGELEIALYGGLLTEPDRGLSHYRRRLLVRHPDGRVDGVEETVVLRTVDPAEMDALAADVGLAPTGGRGAIRHYGAAL